MTERTEVGRNLAMLIDGDNAQYALLEQMLVEVSRYGNVTIRRAYGDWTQPALSNWRAAMLTHAIQPIQQWNYTNSKNATDSALIIDAMDILYSGTVQGFCIVSSDSDYTGLCMRLREQGLFVMGMGRKLTPEAFIKACDVFVHVENLTKPVKPDQPAKVKSLTKPVKPDQPAKAKKLTKPVKPNQSAKAASTNTVSSGASKKLVKLLHRALDNSVKEDGWTHLGALGNALHSLDPNFDSRTYGHKLLSQLIKSLPDQFEIHVESSGSMLVRIKDN